MLNYFVYKSIWICSSICCSLFAQSAMGIADLAPVWRRTTVTCDRDRSLGPNSIRMGTPERQVQSIGVHS
jgi:hypothetical protein